MALAYSQTFTIASLIIDQLSGVFLAADGTNVAVLSLLIAGIFSAGTLGMTYFTLRHSSKRDNTVLEQSAAALLQAASKDVVDMLTRRVELLEAENKELLTKAANCTVACDLLKSTNEQLMHQNYELQSRLLGLTIVKVDPAQGAKQ